MSSAQVQSDSKKRAESSSRGGAVLAVRGDAFVVRRLELPSGTTEPEVAGFVALQLEELSPFPLDQLYHGHVCSSDRRAVLIYAAYRRRFPVDQTEHWPAAQYVLPDFAGVLRQRFPATSVVLLRAEQTLSALLFVADKELPERVASRPLAPDAPADEVERVRRQLHVLVEAGSAREVGLRARGAPEQRTKGLQFFFEPEGSGSGREVFIPGNECWTMDVRDSAFIAEQRRRLGQDLVLWRVVLGAAAAMVLLLLGEVLLGASQGFVSWLDRRNREQAPRIASIRDRDAATMRLEDFVVSGVQPFEMLEAVNRLKPGNSHLTRSVAKGTSVLEFQGWSPDVASVDLFESNLRAAPSVEAVERRPVSTNTGGSTFFITVTFKFGSFSRTEVASP